MFSKNLFLPFIILFCIQLAFLCYAQEELTFSGPIRLSGVKEARYIVKGDFNKDNNVDLAVTNEQGF